MSSKRWTIVCLTLTLLIFGCSDPEVAKVKGPTEFSAVAVAATLSSRTGSDSSPAPDLPAEVDEDEPLEIPQQFQPPRLDLPSDHAVRFGGKDTRGLGAAHLPSIPSGFPQVNGKLADLPLLQGFDAPPPVPVHFPGLSNGGSPIGPKGMLGPGRNGGRPGLPPELPGFPGGTQAELL